MGIGEKRSVLLKGNGVSPMVHSGRVAHFKNITRARDAMDKVVVMRRVTPDIALLMKGARAVIADEGGITSHGANLLREFEVPCVVGTKTATQDLKDGEMVTVDGWQGLVYGGSIEVDHGVEMPFAVRPVTATRVMVSIEVPETIERVGPHVDGVSSLRNDYLLLESGVHPGLLIERDRAHVERILHYGMEMVAEVMGHRPVWYKSLDAPTDEFRLLEGGEDEPHEANPLLGWRGICREVDSPLMLETEYRAVARTVGEGHSNLGIKVPFIRSVKEYRAAKEIASDCRLEPHHDVAFGASVETPDMALDIKALIREGVDFISIGLNDLTMCTLAADRGNELVSGIFDVHHPAVKMLLQKIADACRAHGVFSCVCGRIGHDPILVGDLVEMGFDAVGVSPPYVSRVADAIAKKEKELRRFTPLRPVHPWRR